MQPIWFKVYFEILDIKLWSHLSSIHEVSFVILRCMQFLMSLKVNNHLYFLRTEGIVILTLII